MPWFMTCDTMHAHEKTALCSLEATGLWARAGSWAQARNTGGFVPRAILPKLAPGVTVEHLEALADELVGARIDGIHQHGLWLPLANGWQFHDWAMYQSEVGETPDIRKERIRELRRKAGRKGAASRWQKVASDSKSHDGLGSDPSGPVSPSGSPSGSSDDSDPERVRIEQETGRSRPADLFGGSLVGPDDELPSDWAPNGDHAAFAAKWGLDFENELGKYRSHRLRDGFKCGNWNADFDLWLRKAKDFSRPKNGGRPGPDDQMTRQLARIEQLKLERKGGASGTD